MLWATPVFSAVCLGDPSAVYANLQLNQPAMKSFPKRLFGKMVIHNRALWPSLTDLPSQAAFGRLFSSLRTGLCHPPLLQFHCPHPAHRGEVGKDFPDLGTGALGTT